MGMIDGMMMYSAEDRLDTHAILSNPLAQAKAAGLGVDLMRSAGNISLESYMWHMSLAATAAGEQQQDQDQDPIGAGDTDASGVVEFYGDGAKLGGIKGPPKVHARYSLQPRLPLPPCLSLQGCCGRYSCFRPTVQ